MLGPFVGTSILVPHTKILMPVQDPEASHANPYTCEGAPTFRTQIFMFVQDPEKGENPLHLSKLPTRHTQILTLVQVPNNSSHFFHQGRLFTIPTIPHAPAGSQCFKPNSLPLYRLPIIQTIPYASAGSQCFT
ncbi:hypothetical protein O181_089955 [Austropuccinia psidii MF-1]|uniref:Uncharacterized protein n=1 Tax=Austropuccinia psidii MF-1 TaxID=1389203 RepID=A0A9Q3IUV6_9BASI|nr:hypothetical protein [Austropuccinia psidii MF-1]